MLRLAEVAAVVLALVAAWAPMPAAVVERWFSTGVYPAIQRVLTPVTSALPLAIFDVLLVGAVIAVLVAVGRAARASWRARRVAPLLRVIWHGAAAAAAVYLLFLLLWGFNYRRLPMSERLVVAPGPPAADAVVDLGLRAVGEMNRLHDAAHRIGWSGAESRDPHLRDAFARVLATLSDAPPAVPAPLKRTLLGPYFRWAGVDGMVNPFGLETLANPDLLPFERPFVAAHEWAHLAGYADESEANFVGWLTTLRADEAAQYSGWMYLYWQVNGEIVPEQRAKLAQALGAGPRHDVEAIVARLRRGEWPLLRTAGWAVYDQYLKANRVEQGIRSYGAVITLILRGRFDGEWTPVRRDRAAGDARQ